RTCPGCSTPAATPRRWPGTWPRCRRCGWCGRSCSTCFHRRRTTRCWCCCRAPPPSRIRLPAGNISRTRPQEIAIPQLIKDGPVWTLDLGTDENRFSPEFLSTVDEILDEVASSTEPAALLTTGSDKFFSNGLDLEWIMANAGELPGYVDRIHAMFAKFLTL